MKGTTSVYVDMELKEEADKKGLSLSEVLEEGLRKRLNKTLSVDEINEKIADLLTAIQDLEDMKRPLLDKEREAILSASEKERADAERHAKEEADKKAELDSIYGDMPEAAALTMEQSLDTKFIMKWIDAMRIKYPEKKVSLDVRNWLVDLKSR